MCSTSGACEAFNVPGPEMASLGMTSRCTLAFG